MILQPSPDFRSWLARADLSFEKLAERTDMQASTFYAWFHPQNRPARRGIRLSTAWRVANAYAAVTGVREEEAFKRLFVEVPKEQQEPANVAA